jgi:hypothetical protein
LGDIADLGDGKRKKRGDEFADGSRLRQPAEFHSAETSILGELAADSMSQVKHKRNFTGNLNQFDGLFTFPRQLPPIRRDPLLRPAA